MSYLTQVMNHDLAASGNLGQVTKRNFPIAVLNRMQAAEMDTVDVVGPLCTALDILARSVRLPGIIVGNPIGIFQSGGYARTASPLIFLSHPTPAEVWIEKGRDFLIHRYGSFEDYVRGIELFCLENESALCVDKSRL